MRLWKRASGALKDRNSILATALARKGPHRNPDMEAAVIWATSHDDSHVDYDNAKRVFQWIKVSPTHLRQFAWALCARMEKTRCWVVALKGLILIHGVFCSKLSAVHKIGRLPFDLSNFNDGHDSAAKTWPFNAFIRTYYAFLDHKSALMCDDLKARIKESKDQQKEATTQLWQDLVRIQKMQGLLDMLMQIKPLNDVMIRVVILEAMECVMIEIYDTYSRICDGIAKVLLKIYSASKAEAMMALKVLQKSTTQGEQLADYFEYCREIRILNWSNCPKVERIPDEDIRELERIINGVSGNEIVVTNKAPQHEARTVDEERESKSSLKTIITNDWEVFDEDLVKIDGDEDVDKEGRTIEEDRLALMPLIKFDNVHDQFGNHQELPDLISFL
ncbi:Clathrin assembly protein [Actinidia chinensis var. chinensis]|uniref:Clathrin assembly protein n=1 Tax=Actinidia chinensis var. chinensis TaxID=1590841 RepID=A0A2R6PGB9_ACTCC|nr:Clathrin assembly protein [Actinidia chinensis var. chinensis]